MKNSVRFYLTKQNSRRAAYLIGWLFLAGTAVLGVMLGSTVLSFAEIREMLSQGMNSAAGRIFLYVRLPRTAASLLCGAGLAMAGAVIQGVLANPLASPSIIGVNSGAGLAVTICTAAGIYGGWRLSLGAFVGAFAAVMLVSFGARKWGASRATLVLIGVAMNSLLGAVSDTIVTLRPEVGVMSNDFKIGEFSSVTQQKLLPAGILMLLAMAALLVLHNELDILTLGEDSARGLGMRTTRVRVIFLSLAAVLAGCAVSLAGLLSFVGLLVPHAVRRIAGKNSADLLRLCAIFGAGFVCLCDTLARTVFSPYEIPVGIFMAFLGAPFFVFLLIKGKGGDSHD